MVLSDKAVQIDILGNILDDKHAGTIRGLNELTALTRCSGPRVTGPEQVEPSSPPKTRPKLRRKRLTAKRKSTHYLTAEVFDNLGEAKSLVRDLLPKGSKLKATKSRIVESAVKVLLEEFERNGEESYLVKELLKKSQKETDETSSKV